MTGKQIYIQYMGVDGYWVAVRECLLKEFEELQLNEGFPIAGNSFCFCQGLEFVPPVDVRQKILQILDDYAASQLEQL